MRDQQVNQLFQQMMALVQQHDSFYFADTELNGHQYRIFDYRLASYTEFLAPGGLECRGLMFKMDGDRVVDIASRPFKKFFNLNENPMTIGLDLSQIREVHNKLDGSIMSTYMHGNVVRLKSRASVTSEQSKDANKWMDTQPRFAEALARADSVNHWTVNSEWCAPFNRIVIGYQQPFLRVLGARNRYTGEDIDHDQVVDFFVNEMGLSDDFVSRRVDVDLTDPAQWVKSVMETTGIEGYVFLINGMRVKLKTNWYVALHHVKDSVDVPRRLFEAVLDGGIDDMRSMMYDDPVSMKKIDDMEKMVLELVSHASHLVKTFYAEHKDLDRKQYALAVQKVFTGQDALYKGCMFSLYDGRPDGLIDVIRKSWKAYGLTDAVKK